MLREYINLQELEGKWHIILTNFPMWLKGDKKNPNFNYKIAERDSVMGLIDEVKYKQNGQTKSINGFDKQLNIENTSFEFYAVKDINPGEEIFVWYGDENYWSDGRQTTVVI